MKAAIRSSRKPHLVAIPSVYSTNTVHPSIVAVHGLNGHCEKTWTSGNDANSVNWLRDLLPHDLRKARILSWGYDANTHSRSRVSCQYLFDHAPTLVSDLCLKRQITDVQSGQTRHQTKAKLRQTRKRPIVFVAHSLGGIIVKSAGDIVKGTWTLD